MRLRIPLGRRPRLIGFQRVTYYPDLGPETMVVSGPDIRAIGWLAAGHPFATGPTPSAFRQKLQTHMRAAMPSVYMGFHSCDLCDRDPVHDKRELAVPAGPVLYVAPAMIGHYIDVHGYRPPDEFIRAVESGPRRGSLRHRLAMLRHFRHGFSWYFVSRPAWLLGLILYVVSLRLTEWGPDDDGQGGPALVHARREPYSIPEKRELRPDERELLAWMLAQDASLTSSVDQLKVIARCGCGECPTILLGESFEEQPVPGWRTKVPVECDGRAPDGHRVGVALHVSGGKPTELEAFPGDDCLSVAWPEIATLERWDET